MGSDDLIDEIAHLLGLDAFDEVLVHLVFLSGEDVDDKPLVRVSALQSSCGIKRVEVDQLVNRARNITRRVDSR